MKTVKSRRKQMSQAEVEKLRSALIAAIVKGPCTCPELAKRHGMISRTLMNHLAFLKNLGLIHCLKIEQGSRAPFTWFPGPGESVQRQRVTKRDVEEMPQLQKRVTSWPTVQIPKQGIFAALGL